MASASAPVDQRNRADSQKSHFQQTICLVDWWLIKAENGAHGRGLGVAGFSSREKQAVRVFSSAPILKRYDVFTLETTDGICVILNGFINKDRTLGNGFPSGLCDYFGFGFPPYWKDYHDKFLGNVSSSKDDSVNPLEKISRHSEMEGGQMPADSHEKDFGSHGKMNAKSIRGSKNVESGKNDTTKANFDKDSKGVNQTDKSIAGKSSLSKKMNAKSIRGSKNVESGKNDTTKANFDKDSKGVNQTDKSIAGKSSLSKKAKDFGVESQRKSACINKGTPDGKKKRVPSASPESFSVNRSRSGRLLMPTLEFWRNQRAVYSADRSVAGIEQGTDKQPRIKIPQKRGRKRKRQSR